MAKVTMYAHAHDLQKLQKTNPELTGQIANFNNLDTEGSAKEVTQIAKIRLPAPFNRKDNILEAELLHQCQDALKKDKSIKFWKRIQVNGQIRHTAEGSFLTASTLTGLPDLIFVRDGILHGVELKVSGGTISRQQLNILNEMQDAGCKVWICTNLFMFNKVLDVSMKWDDYNIKLENICVI